METSTAVGTDADGIDAVADEDGDDETAVAAEDEGDDGGDDVDDNDGDNGVQDTFCAMHSGKTFRAARYGSNHFATTFLPVSRAPTRMPGRPCCTHKLQRRFCFVTRALRVGSTTDRLRQGLHTRGTCTTQARSHSQVT